MKKKKIAFIGEYLLSFKGGAEKSIFNELKELSKKYEVRAYSFDCLYHKGNFKRDKINILNYGLKYYFSISRFISLYCLNESFIYSHLKKLQDELKKCDYVIIQGLFAPIVSKFLIDYNIPYHYYIRDENQLNIFNNYEIGIRKYLKKAKNLLEYSALKKFKKMNLDALNKAKKIICNSEFIKKLLKKKFNLNSTIVYPKINRFKLRRKDIDPENQKYISFIGGGNAMKGYDIVLKIAKKMPEEKFLIVGPYKKEITKKNIIFTPFKKDILSIFKKTKILLVPSRWNEAYGRAVVEANLMNIPAITSNKGGLPEANKNKKNIVKDLENINLWIKKINNNLNKQ